MLPLLIMHMNSPQNRTQACHYRCIPSAQISPCSYACASKACGQHGSICLCFNVQRCITWCRKSCSLGQPHGRRETCALLRDVERHPSWASWPSPEQVLPRFMGAGHRSKGKIWPFAVQTKLKLRSRGIIWISVWVFKQRYCLRQAVGSRAPKGIWQ